MVFMRVLNPEILDKFSTYLLYTNINALIWNIFRVPFCIRFTRFTVVMLFLNVCFLRCEHQFGATKPSTKCTVCIANWHVYDFYGIWSRLHCNFLLAEIDDGSGDGGDGEQCIH